MTSKERFRALCTLFANEYIVLVDEVSTGVDRKLEAWRGLEFKGFKLSKTKTEYIKFKFEYEFVLSGELHLGGGNVDKVGFLWELKGAKERLQLVKADLLEEGSFDEAFEGVDGVFHTASPVVPGPYGDDVQEVLIDPAIKGTANVLKSCVKARVKRVVLTSSSSTTRGRDDCQQVSPLNESHWSDADYCKRYQLWYAYSKMLAEKEAWNIAKENGLDLVVVVPSFVVGPMLPPQPTSSLLLLLSVIKGTRGGIPNQIIGFVHIDDVVSAHVLAMEESKASGRLLCSGPVANWLEIVEILKAKYPMYPYETQLSINQQGDANPHSNDTSKIIELGFPGFKTIPEMLDDCIRSFRDHGLLD